MMRRLAGFSGMLVITMAMSVISFFALLVIASQLQEEFSISKLQIGILAGVNTGVGGVLSPLGGRVSDRLGGRGAMASVLVISGATSIFIATAQSYAALVTGMGLAGVAQGLGNPATNRAIATGITAERRGMVTGVKQSGVQLAVFASGFTMPWLTEAYGWRTGLWLMAGAALLAVPGVVLITESPIDDRGDRPFAPTATRVPLTTFVNQVSVYGFLLGMIGGGTGGFLPLFAEEAAGLSASTAGQVFGLQGLVAIPTRILSGMLLDRGVSARRILLTMASGGAISLVLVLASSSGTTSLLWLGAVLSGMTLGSWNTAANLSMIREGHNAGRASGRLMLGFLLGTTVGGPLVGWSIDVFDSYRQAWLGSAAVALLAGVVVNRRSTVAVRTA